MKSSNVSYWFILALFLAAGTLSWRVYFKSYVQSDNLSIHHFPKVIGDWTSEDLPISDDDKAILETDNVFVRRYTNSIDEEVSLFIVYSENNRKVSHPPEICYTGGMPSGNPTTFRTGGTATATWTISGADESATIDWSGLSISDTRQYVYIAETVEVIP